jgi:hypothetical protein
MNNEKSMNHVEFNLRLHHPIATANILDKWFRILYNDLVEDDDVYNIKYSYQKLKHNKTTVIIVTVCFDTPMIFEELIEFMNYFIEFDNANIYTLYKVPVSIELYEDKIIYNKEVFHLQDLTIRTSRMSERLSELKYKWNQL